MVVLSRFTPISVMMRVLAGVSRRIEKEDHESNLSKLKKSATTKMSKLSEKMSKLSEKMSKLKKMCKA